MRSRVAFVLVTTLAGCSHSASDSPRDQPDAQITTSEDAADAGKPPPPPPPPPPTFQIVGPTLDIAAGEEATFCYYFHMPNATDVAIRRWTSHMTAGVHDMVLYVTQTDLQRAGTVSADRCGFAINGVGPVWIYSAQSPDDEMVMPPDDGNGAPVGQPIRAGRPAFLEMHFLNTTGAVLHPHVELGAYAYDDGVQVTPAGSFYTYTTTIDIDPGSAAAPAPGTASSPPNECSLPAGAKFFFMSTHTHKQGVHTFVKDAATTVFDSTSWEHPGAATWKAAPFYTFTRALTYQCEYMNPNNRRIEAGDDPVTQETCMAVGFFFPSPGGASLYCLDGAQVN
jgi:hypothetical protein